MTLIVSLVESKRRRKIRDREQGEHPVLVVVRAEVEEPCSIPTQDHRTRLSKVVTSFRMAPFARKTQRMTPSIVELVASFVNYSEPFQHARKGFAKSNPAPRTSMISTGSIPTVANILARSPTKESKLVTTRTMTAMGR
jgi:hypothetical protein